MGIALVYGAAGGLGQHVVRAFEERGDEVVALDHARLDVSDPEAVERFWDDLERGGELPRWVVNTIGGFREGSVVDMEPWDVRATFSLNLETVWWAARAAAKRLQPGSAIVNIAARAGLSGGAGSAAYAVSKAGVIRLSQVLAEELRPRGIRVNAVLPALIDTPHNRATLSEGAMERAVSPVDIAAVITHLCSDAASVVSGATVPVYGNA
jgi:NAD(P)-dependent dehydrogenase (short-subunit alcohol dehydrogenase family)